MDRWRVCKLSGTRNQNCAIYNESSEYPTGGLYYVARLRGPLGLFMTPRVTCLTQMFEISHYVNVRDDGAWTPTSVSVTRWVRESGLRFNGSGFEVQDRE